MCSVNETLYMLVEHDLADTVLKRLKMYVMRSKVVFEQIEATILGVLNKEQAASLPFNLNNERYSCVQSEGQPNASNEGNTQKPFALFFGDRYLVVDLSNSLAQQTGHTWLDHDIKDGLPRVTADTSEAFVPQMLNMDILNGINFKKGCYTGQEIIARMHYLGKLKQRSFVCQLSSESKAQSQASPRIGEKVVDNDGKTLGTVVNANSNNSYFFASLRFDNLSNGIACENGAKAELVSVQPYNIDVAKTAES